MKSTSYGKLWKILISYLQICRLLIANNIICDTLRDLVPFTQFKKREKRPKVTLLECFSRFANCADGTKSYKASHISLNDNKVKVENRH